MQNYWTKKGVYFGALPLDDWAGKHELPNKFGLRNWVARTSDNARYPCDLLWTSIAISAEGFVMYCCHDYKLLSSLPNVNEKSLRQIWEEQVSEERKKHVEGSIDKDPCLNCDAWKTRQPYLHRPSLVHVVANLLPPKYKLRARTLRDSVFKTLSR